MASTRFGEGPEARDLLASLIKSSALGDQSAFNRLHALTCRKMRKAALSVLRSKGDVDDVLQDAYLKVWRHAASFDPTKSSPISWISVIVRNTALDVERRRKQPTTDLDIVRDVVAIDDEQDDFDYAYARKIADRVIARLPEDRRMLLSLAYIEGRSREALSLSFGVPVSTIKTWLRRTLEGVRTDCAAIARRPPTLALAATVHER